MSATPTAAIESREFPGFHDPGAPIWRSASGDRVTAVNGREFVDLAAGFGAAMWGHRPAPASAASLGLGDLHTTELREHAELSLCSLVERYWCTPTRSIILQTGSEAVETAMKTALLARAPRVDVVAFEGAYHGTFGLALAVSHRNVFRAPFAAWLPESRVRFEPYGTVPALDKRVACVIVEPIQGRSGVIVPPQGFLRDLRAACNDAGALLVIDAVLTGCGRTGVPLDGMCTSVDVRPDMLCLGKALGGGVPASAVVTTAEVAHFWSGRGPEAIHTSTYLGHPLACGAMLQTIDALDHTDLAAGWSAVAAAMRRIGETTPWSVRGRGGLHAIDTRQPGGGTRLAHHLLEHGFIAVPSGIDGSVLSLTPSLVTDAATWRRIADVVAAFAAG